MVSMHLERTSRSRRRSLHRPFGRYRLGVALHRRGDRPPAALKVHQCHRCRSISRHLWRFAHQHVRVLPVYHPQKCKLRSSLPLQASLQDAHPIVPTAQALAVASAVPLSPQRILCLLVPWLYIVVLGAGWMSASIRPPSLRHSLPPSTGVTDATLHFTSTYIAWRSAMAAQRALCSM